MNRFHVHGTIRDLTSQDEIATVTVTLDADDDGDAQTRAWELFDDDLVSFDTTEIEEAE
jgi:hypothetical protein